MRSRNWQGDGRRPGARRLPGGAGAHSACLRIQGRQAGPMIRRVLPALALLPVSAASAQDAPATPASIVAEAAAGEWERIAADDLLVMELAPAASGEARSVVIQLLPAPLARGWVENIRTLARGHWWDGTSIYRVVDNWVAQWGDGEDERADPKPLPEGLNVVPESEYVASNAAVADAEANWEAMAQALLGNSSASMQVPGFDGSSPYAEDEYFFRGWPLAAGDNAVWPIHCYAAVGVARDLSPDTGTGAELYAVIGHAPRQLDRNIAVVGRVIVGIEHLAILPRGTGEAGVYATPEEHTPIVSVRLASELPEASRPRFEYLASDSSSFARYVAVRANRRDEFYRVPAGGVDICNVQVPIRSAE